VIKKSKKDTEVIRKRIVNNMITRVLPSVNIDLLSSGIVPINLALMFNYFDGISETIPAD
jgi:uncharacterized protein YtpQ (UPF0354 family)